MATKRKHIVKRILIGVVSTIVGIVVVLGGLSAAQKPLFHGFYSRAEVVTHIPGLDDDYVPQGVAYHQGAVLTCGYRTDGGASQIFVSRQGGWVTSVSLKWEDKNYTGHCGGMAIADDTIYLAGGSHIYAVPLQDVLQAETGAVVTLRERMAVNNRASFVFADHNYVYVGEYYDHATESYHTDDSHIFGDNHAICTAYALDDSSFGVSSQPSFVLSLPEYAQGFAVTDSGRYVVSTSHGIALSHLLVYSGREGRQADYTFDGVPVYYLGKQTLEEDVKLSPMSEDLDYCEGKLYINFESASNKYKVYNIWPTKSVMAFTVA